jgi:hypothetical protein
MKPIKFIIDIVEYHLTMDVLVGEDVSSSKDRHKYHNFVTKVAAVESWLRDYDGIYFQQGFVHGYEKKKFKYTGHFRIECECPELREFLTGLEFELNNNEYLENVMAIRKAPFRLWGKSALKRELLNVDGMTQDKIDELDKDQMVAILEQASADSPEQEQEIWDEDEEVASIEDIK